MYRLIPANRQKLLTCSLERNNPYKLLSTCSLARKISIKSTRHQPDAIVPRGDGGIDGKSVRRRPRCLILLCAKVSESLTLM